MAPKKSEDDRVAIVGDVPAHLLQLVGEVDGKETIETMQHHRVLNRLDIVQSMSPLARKEKHKEGSAIVSATDMKVAGFQEFIDVIPVMFFDEFIAWNDRNDKGASSKIHEQTLDMNSQLALKCQDKRTWKEAYGETDPNTGRPRFLRSNTHHLTFVCLCTSGVLQGQVVAFSLARGNWGAGTAWIGKIKSRQVAGKQAPLFATRWKARVIPKNGRGGESYFGWEIEQADSPWATPEEIVVTRELHEQLKAEYKQKALRVDHSASDDEETVAADDGGPRRF